MNPDELAELRERQELIADSLWEPIIKVKTDRTEFSGGYQALFDFMVIHRPKVVTVTVEEWEDLSDIEEVS
jgi:hypothetical protein